MAILKSLMVENFASFADKIEFTTETEIGKKEFPENSFITDEGMFNKISFIYGANGSGKTFFCKIIREIQRLLLWSPCVTMGSSNLPTQIKELDKPIKPFMFDDRYKDKPSKFAIEIIINKMTYHYEFFIRDRKIEYELLTKRYKRTEKLIERLSPSYKDIALKSELKEFNNKKQTVKEEALCLSVAGLFNNKLANEIVNAILNIRVINMATGILSPPPKEAFSNNRVKKYVEILQKADPTLREINVSFKEEEIDHHKNEGDDFENREIIAKKLTVDVKTGHAVYENGIEMVEEPLSFFSEESLGTVKLFTMLPYLFDVLEEGGIFVIDEIENGLHLSLTKEIIGLFKNEESNPNHSQLICTSHQPLLVDGEFRRDQVWITSKDYCGKCFLHRMSDLKTSRAKTNLSNRILEGAFGCNPEMFFSSFNNNYKDREEYIMDGD